MTKLHICHSTASTGVTVEGSPALALIRSSSVRAPVAEVTRSLRGGFSLVSRQVQAAEWHKWCRHRALHWPTGCGQVVSANRMPACLGPEDHRPKLGILGSVALSEARDQVA